MLDRPSCSIGVEDFSEMNVLLGPLQAHRSVLPSASRMRGEAVASNEADSMICFSPDAAVRAGDPSFDGKPLPRREPLDGGYTVAKKKAAKKAAKKVAKKTAKKKAKK